MNKLVFFIVVVLSLLFPPCVNAQDNSICDMSIVVTDTSFTDLIDTLSQDSEQNCFVSISPQCDFDYHNTWYWQKSRVKKFSAGTCLAVGGFSLATYGFVRALVGAFGNTPGFSWFDAVWGGGSAMVMATSIPLYVSASKDRKKARNMTFEEFQADRHRKDYKKNGLRYQPSFYVNMPVDHSYGHGHLGWGVSFEGRSYLGTSNFDLGVRFAYDRTFYHRETNYDGYTYDEKYDENSLRLSILSDYNFMKNEKINPFIGIGAGVSPTAVFFFEPRAGVELYNHCRLTLGGHLTPLKDYDAKLSQNCYLEIGYSF